MKIAIKDLEPNPFKNLEKYPIDKERVAKLKGSIEGLKFWKGLVCRPHPTKEGKYQLAFGHHRIEVMKELGHTTISMTVLNYNDDEMLLAMAEENRDSGQSSDILNVVEQAKKRLDDEFRKYKLIKDLPIRLINLLAERNQNSLANARRGVGRDTILKYLNKNKTKWTTDDIEFALSILNNPDTIDEEAIVKFTVPYQAKEFKEAITSKKHLIPKKKQKEIADKVIKEQNKRKVEKKKGVPSGGRAIKQIVKDIIEPKKKKSDDFHKAETAIENIENLSKKLVTNIAQLKELLSKMNVTQIAGINVLGAEIALRDLINEFKKFEIEQKKKSKQITGKVGK